MRPMRREETYEKGGRFLERKSDTQSLVKCSSSNTMWRSFPFFIFYFVNVTLCETPSRLHVLSILIFLTSCSAWTEIEEFSVNQIQCNELGCSGHFVCLYLITIMMNCSASQSNQWSYLIQFPSWYLTFRLQRETCLMQNLSTRLSIVVDRQII